MKDIFQLQGFWAEQEFWLPWLKNRNLITINDYHILARGIGIHYLEVPYITSDKVRCTRVRVLDCTHHQCIFRLWPFIENSTTVLIMLKGNRCSLCWLMKHPIVKWPFSPQIWQVMTVEIKEVLVVFALANNRNSIVHCSHYSNACRSIKKDIKLTSSILVVWAVTSGSQD